MGKAEECIFGVSEEEADFVLCQDSLEVRGMQLWVTPPVLGALGSILNACKPAVLAIARDSSTLGSGGWGDKELRLSSAT